MTSPTGFDAGQAVRRRLRSLSLPDQDLMVLLAADHRNNLLKQLPDDLSTEDAAAAMTTLKVDFARDLGSASTGYLTDPKFGLFPCLADPQVDPKLPIISALEETGYTGSAWDRMPTLIDGFGPDVALKAGATGAKFLIYYHPDAENAQEKRDLCQQVAQSCEAAAIPLFLEPLVYPLAEDKPLAPGTDEFEDAVVQTAAELSATKPTVMKVQFPGGGLDSRDRWANACRRLDEACVVPWVLLGAGVSFEDFIEQTKAACSAGASGVLVGRTIWGETVNQTPTERASFLQDVGRKRLAQLEDAVSSTGRPWSSSGSLSGSLS